MLPGVRTSKPQPPRQSQYEFPHHHGKMGPGHGFYIFEMVVGKQDYLLTQEDMQWEFGH